MLNKIEANKFLSNLTAEELLELNSLVVSKIKAMRSVKTAVAVAAFNVGDKVQFNNRKLGCVCVGVVTKVKQKNIDVSTDRGVWIVGATLLQKVA